jgi:hypothetical protein
LIRYLDKFYKSPAAGFDGIFNWDFLKPAFSPTKIEPMDIDAIIERNCKFLIFETKDSGIPVPDGQQITLNRLASIGPFTVILLWAKSPETINGWDVWFKGARGVCKKHVEGNSDDLTNFVRRWFIWASAQGHFFQPLCSMSTEDDAPQIREENDGAYCPFCGAREGDGGLKDESGHYFVNDEPCPNSGWRREIP